MDRVGSRRASSDLRSIVVDAVAQSGVSISQRSFNGNVQNDRNVANQAVRLLHDRTAAFRIDLADSE
ncbi:hypothetical protein ACU5AX_15200 [Sphingomonas sp. XXL09]|uniref:hypothetical protein n=1 Tax=Sphingomonas sp. XXL09 TaxID=3457787 RepID=UPI00406BB8C3